MKQSLVKPLTLLLCFIVSSWCYAQTPVAKNGQLRVIGTKLCNQYGNPIQLRGMSTHGIQWYGWGSCLTEASLDALAYDWGGDVLRISMYIQEGGYETNPSGFTSQVKRLIDEATERGMYALVDWHQLTPGDPNYNLARAKTFFTEIANTYKNSNNIIYDVCNEPNGVSWATIKSYADQIIPVIRAIDSDAVICVGTHAWGSMGISDGRNAQDIVNNPLSFSNIMYTFHFYAKDHQTEYLNELSWAADRLPVFVTEFGSQEASGDGPNDFTMTQKYIDLMRTKKISWTNWNYSDDFRSGAVWKTGTCSNGPWTTAQLKESGLWIRDKMLNPADDFPTGNNQTPTVSITAPAAGASFTAPASITINASAADADGTVTQVAFYQGSTLLGTDTSSPYSFAWTNVAAGSYALTARATDNSGAVTTSSSVNVTVTANTTQSPYNGTPFAIPGKIEVEQYDLGGQGVAYNDLTSGNSGTAFRTEDVDIEATTDTGGGYNLGWVQPGEWVEYTVNVTTTGSYTLQARVAALNAGNSFHLEANGTNISGTVTVPSTGDWQTWQTVTVTTTSLTAGQKVLRLVIDAGEFNTNYINFVATNTPPTISITSPVAGTSFTAPASVTINANAADANGTVSQVAFYNGATLLGTDTSSPYSFSWTNVAAGNYTLTAVATDNQGATATSSAVSISVVSPTATNLALNKTVTVSSVETTGLEGGKAVDGNATTRWGSLEGVDPQSITVDLGASYSISRVKITWETAYGKNFVVEVSPDNSGWSLLKDVQNNTALVNDYTGLAGTGRYVRLTGTARGTEWGYSIYELEVYGTAATAKAAAEEVITIYPTPAEDHVTIQLPEGKHKGSKVILSDVSGKVYLTESVKGSTHELDLRAVPSGMYLVQIVNGKSKTVQRIWKK